ncbi:hypothetical protein [Novipirellula artificiosorum]|nr:hypothetical protein [Novipirellula artificiosorum]
MNLDDPDQHPISEASGTGTFLLAASEMLKLAETGVSKTKPTGR